MQVEFIVLSEAERSFFFTVLQCSYFLCYVCIFILSTDHVLISFNMKICVAPWVLITILSDVVVLYLLKTSFVILSALLKSLTTLLYCNCQLTVSTMSTFVTFAIGKIKGIWQEKKCKNWMFSESFLLFEHSLVFSLTF